jgi:hypothetical protein
VANPDRTATAGNAWRLFEVAIGHEELLDSGMLVWESIASLARENASQRKRASCSASLTGNQY